MSDDSEGTPIPKPMTVDPEALAHPQQFHKMMRDADPVLAMEGGVMDATIVFRHDDVLQVLHDHETFSSNDDAVAIGQVRPLIPLQIDPP